MRLPSRTCRCVLVAVALAAWTLVTVQPASAAIAFVRKGSEVSASGASITLTLSVASTAGDLLVATISDLNGNCTTDSITAPSGWTRAAHSCRGSAGPVEIWYRPNAPSTSSVLFNTGSSGANAKGQLSEFSGVATSSSLDQTGTANNSTASTSPSVATSGSIAGDGEVAVTAFNTATGLSTLTAGSGWSSLTSDTSGGFDSDYRLSPTKGATLTESLTTSPQTSWGAVIATFKVPPCSNGSLSMNAPASTSFTAVTLDGTNQTTTGSVVLAPDDERGSGAGWNITGTSTTFTTGSKTLSTTSTTATGASAAAGTGNCSLPTNSVGYPVALPAGTTPPTAVKLYNAATATGQGPTNVTLNFQLAVPANTFRGTYTSTWTFAIVSGP